MTNRYNCFLIVFFSLTVASLTKSARSVQAEVGKRIVTEEKANSISAAMESSLEGLPQLYQLVSNSIVRVETSDNVNVTGVIVSSEGHVLVGNVFAYLNGINSSDAKVHLSDGRTVTARATGLLGER